MGVNGVEAPRLRNKAQTFLDFQEDDGGLTTNDSALLSGLPLSIRLEVNVHRTAKQLAASPLLAGHREALHKVYTPDTPLLPYIHLYAPVVHVYTPYIHL